MRVYNDKKKVKLTIPTRQWHELPDQLQLQLQAHAQGQAHHHFSHDFFFRPSVWYIVRKLIPQMKRWPRKRDKR